MEQYDEILARMRAAYEQESGHRPEDVSETGLRLRVLAGELYRLRSELAWLERQAFPHTASGEYLDRHGAQRGVVRREAARAVGEVTFSRYLPLSFDLVVPAGTVCASSGNAVEYETLADAVLAAGKLTVNVACRAVLGGTSGNAAAGYVNTLATPPTGINYVTNKVPFTGGRDPEGDEEYRARVLNAYANGSNGTNAGYYREAALAYPGVGSAGVEPRVNGAGTVGVFIWGEDGPPTAETVSGLAAELARQREIGVTVSVEAAASRAVNVYARIRVKPGTEFARARQNAEEAVRLCFAGMEVGSPFYLAEVSRAILQAAPVEKLEFSAGMRDIESIRDTIFLPGEIEVEEIV